jgi:hypothetical protein
MDNHMHEHLAATSGDAHSHNRGTWGGHVLPGSLFCLWGAFWLISISTRAAVHHRSHGFTFEAKTHFPTSVSRLLEVQLRTLLPLLGCFVELYAHPGDVRVRQPWDADGRWDAHSAVNYHHAAMYAAFSFSGAVDWLTARWPRASAHVPPGFNWAALTGAFLAEAVLFVFHLRMQSGMTALLHVLLIGLVLCNAAAVAAAGLMPSSVTAALLCAYFMLCQGSLFFWQARILYGPSKWDLDDGGSAMMLPVLFIGISLFCATAVLAVHLAVAASPRRLALLLDARPPHKLVASEHRDASDEESSHAVSLRDA